MGAGYRSEVSDRRFRLTDFAADEEEPNADEVGVLSSYCFLEVGDARGVARLYD